MSYLIAFHWPWLLAALLIGAVVGWLTFMSQPRHWIDSLVGWLGALAVAALVVALLKFIPGRIGYWLETALLLFASYLIGCFLGWLAKYASYQNEVAPALAGAAATGAAATAAVMPRTAPVVPTPPAKPVAKPAKPAAAKPVPAAPVVSTPAPSPAPAVLVPAAAPKLPDEDQHPGLRPQGLLTARDGRRDDLKRIKGIGAQNEGRLHGIGIWHFDQIAAWTEQNVEWVASYLAFPGRIDREQWVAQAKVLATGGETEFSKRVDAGEVDTSKDDGTHGQANVQYLKPHDET